jgi:hypothetical protein
MPILYKMKQITAPNTSATGKYYALTQYTGTWRTRDVTKLIHRSSFSLTFQLDYSDGLILATCRKFLRVVMRER